MARYLSGWALHAALTLYVAGSCLSCNVSQLEMAPKFLHSNIPIINSTMDLPFLLD